MTAREHNNLLGIFFLIQGGLTAMIGVIMTLIYGGVGVAMMGVGTKDEDRMIGGIMFAVGLVVGIVLLGIAAAVIYTGVKVRRQAPIGRTLGIVMSILSLLSFPLGTALGIYGLWFFFGDMGRALYGGSSGPGYTGPPPPNSWQ